MALLRLAYVSSSSLPGNLKSHEAVADILTSARRNNEAAGVSGALLVTDAAFAQVLEGEEAAVEATYKRITLDRRHHDIVLLLREPISERQFPQWAMAHIGPSQPAEEAVARLTQNVPGTGSGDAARGLVSFMSRMLSTA
jgi:Sensors of blue-light using FAD